MKKKISTTDLGTCGNYGVDISIEVDESQPFLKIDSHAFGDFYSNLSICVTPANMRELAQRLIEGAAIIEALPEK